MAEEGTPSPKIPSMSKAQEPRMFFVNSVMKGDDVIRSGASEKEDRFQKLETSQGGKGPITIAPPIDPRDLRLLVQRNSILRPLIDAYATNIDGTGWELTPQDEKEQESDADEQINEDVSAFFDQPWFGVSFTTTRKMVRVDVEETGNGFMEILRNAKEEVVGLRHIDAVDMRLVRLGEEVKVTKTIMRAGKAVELDVWVRERRYAQIVAGKLVYFKDFSATRDLNRDTGTWAPKGTRVPFDKRAAEIIHYTAVEDVDTPYGLPRWYSNSPSVTGSRKAEEYNLQFFDSGGVPPLLLIVQGGKLAADAERALRDHFMSTGESRHQAAILEAYAATGAVDSSQSVRVTVERFGAERQQDSMFENYIANAEERIRRSFRLPPIFLGSAQDFSFATAFASYTVAEVQVFQPERDEFDEKINLMLMPAIKGAEGLSFKSLPLSVRDTAQQLEAIGMVIEKATPESVFEALNQISELSLQLDEEKIAKEEEKQVREEDLRREEMNMRFGGGGSVMGEPPAPGKQSSVQRSADITTGLAALAEDAGALIGHGIGASSEHSDQYGVLLRQIQSLTEPERKAFRAMLTLEMFPQLAHDPSGAAELAGCAFALVAQNAVEDDAGS